MSKITFENETELKNFTNEVLLEASKQEKQKVPFITSKLAVEEAPKEVKFKRWLQAKDAGDLAVVKALSGAYGTTLPIEFASDMYNLINEYSLANYCTKYTTTTGQIQVQTLSTKPTVVAVAQGDPLSVGNAANTNKLIEIKKYAAYETMSKELLMDNNYDLYGHLLKMYAEAVAKKMDTEILAEIKKEDALGNSIGGTIIDLGLAVAADITLENLISLYTGIQAGATKNSRWAMHRSTFAKVLGLVQAGTGIFVNQGNLSSPSLLGYPMNMSEAADVYVKDVDKFWAYFGDFANIGLGMRQEMEAELLKEGTLGAGGATVNLANTRQVALVVDIHFGVKTLDKNGIAVLKS